MSLDHREVEKSKNAFIDKPTDATAMALISTINKVYEKWADKLETEIGEVATQAQAIAQNTETDRTPFEDAFAALKSAAENASADEEDKDDDADEGDDDAADGDDDATGTDGSDGEN